MSSRFEQVMAEHGRSVGRIISSYAAPGQDREDLLQEVALSIWQALPRFRGDSSVRTFVLRIAHNKGIDHVVRERMRSRRVTGEPVREPADTAPGPDMLISGRQTEERLMEAVRTLSLGRRQVLTLALEGLTHAEIAHVLGISESNVGVRLHRARSDLRNSLKE